MTKTVPMESTVCPLEKTFNAVALFQDKINYKRRANGK